MSDESVIACEYFPQEAQQALGSGINIFNKVARKSGQTNKGRGLSSGFGTMSDKGEPIVNLHDLRQRAETILPKADFEYYEGGAEDEVTLKANAGAYSEIKIWPRVMVR